jgi:hypothetical protein
MVLILLKHQKRCKMVGNVQFCVVGKEWCKPKMSPTNLPQILSNQFVDAPTW